MTTDRSTVTYAIAPERMPMIDESKMTPAQKKAAADITAGPRGEVKGQIGRAHV